MGFKERWESLRDGYLPPEKLDVSGVDLHTDYEADVEPITYEVLRSRLWSINWDHQDTIRRVSGSGVTVYADDFNTTIATEDGDGVVFGPSIQFFAGCADLAIKWTIEHRGPNVGIRPGDVFIHDDPWVGTNHQMDTAVYAPVFVDGRLYCWVYNCVHQQELGGVEPGGFVQQAVDAYWEATAFPPVKLIDRGEWREDLVDAWIRRSRNPELCLLELKSQVAGIEFAKAQVEAAIAEYGAEVLKGVMRGMIHRTEAAFRRRLDLVPNGTWTDVRYIAGALPGDRSVYKMALAVTKNDEGLVFDNAGTDPATGSFNVAPGVWRAAVLNAAMPLLAYDQYLCGAGVLRCIQFRPDLGTITSARHPAAVSTSLGTTSAVTQAQYVLNKMMSAAPELRPDILGASALHTQVYTQMFGKDSKGNDYANFPFDGVGGGSGAFSFRDGINHGGGIISTRLRIGGVEEWERSIPFLYLYRKEVAGGGGHGQWRGGTGLASGWTGHKTTESFISSGGLFQSVTHGHGLSGGYPGSGGSFWSALDTDLTAGFEEGRLPGSPDAVRAMAPHGGLAAAKKYDHRLVAGDIFEVTPCLGAGHGDPLKRLPSLVVADVADGQLPVEDARRLYGVVLDGDGGFDAGGTEEARDRIRAARRAHDAHPNPTGGPVRRLDEVTGWALETVRVGSLDGVPWLGCADCETALAPLDSGNYRDACCWDQQLLEHIDPRVFMPSLSQTDTALVLRQYVCPGCGGILDSDVCQADDPAYRDVALAPEVAAGGGSGGSAGADQPPAG
ncbi:MAG: hypothetical protein JWM05_134 [Acidimicrobiales bacterium]|nr:hypothetical protein [Acidimicrobiales bacterium]